MNAHVSTTTRVIARCWKVQDSSLTQMCQTAVRRGNDFSTGWSVVSKIVMTTSKSVRGGCGIYDVTAYIFRILSLTFTSKSVMGRRRFARCIVEMGDCRRRRRA